MSRRRVYIVASVCLLVFLWTTVALAKSCEFSTQRVQCGDLGCDQDTHTCIKCRSNDDCYPTSMKCQTSDGKCVVRSFFDTFNYRTFLAMIFGVVVCAIGVIAGVGGGGILVPMFTALMQLPMETAVALSQSTIVGQCVLNLSVVLPRKYPDERWERPLVNYQYLSLMLPLGLIGTLLGGILSPTCPDVVRIILLFIILSAVLYRTIGKMKKQYRSDRAARQVTVVASEVVTPVQPDVEPGTEAAAPLSSTSTTTEAATSSPIEERNALSKKDESEARTQPQVQVQGSEGTEVVGDVDPSVANATAAVAAAAAAAAAAAVAESTAAVDPNDISLKAPQQQYPRFEIAMCLSCFFVLLIFNIIRSFSSCGGFWYWIAALVPLVYLGGACYYVRERLHKFSVESPTQLTFRWNRRNSVYYPLAAVIAGAAAAMLGIGGGLVLSFVLYEIGLIPEEASVTGGVATFLIALSSALQLLVGGHLLLDFGIVFFFVGMTSTGLGQFVFMRYIHKHGLTYLIVASLAFMVGGSLLALTVFGIYDAVVKTRIGGSIMAFGALCHG